MSRFSDYNSSQIVPQLTLLEKFNKLIEWLKDNPQTKVFRINTNYVAGTLQYNDSDIIKHSLSVNVGDLVVFNNSYLGEIESQSVVEMVRKITISTPVLLSGGGSTYTAGNGITISNGTISIDEQVVATVSDIPTKTSDLTNDSGFITNSALSSYATIQYVDDSVVGLATTSEVQDAIDDRVPEPVGSDLGKFLKVASSGTMWVNLPASEPDTYIKSASVSGNTLSLINKDNSTTNFTPTGKEDLFFVELGTTTSYAIGEAVENNKLPVIYNNSVMYYYDSYSISLVEGTTRFSRNFFGVDFTNNRIEKIEIYNGNNYESHYYSLGGEPSSYIKSISITDNGDLSNLVATNKSDQTVGLTVPNVYDISLTGTSGTLTNLQFQAIYDSTNGVFKYTTIICDDELYRLQDDQHENGYLVYSHTGQDSTNNYYIKCITITLSTRGWVKTSNQVQAKLTAGENITISNNVISASGGGSLYLHSIMIEGDDGDSLFLSSFTSGNSSSYLLSDFITGEPGNYQATERFSNLLGWIASDTNIDILDYFVGIVSNIDNFDDTVSQL